MSREEHKDAIEVSVIFHEGQRMFAVPKQPAQQEPVAKVCHDLDGHIGWNPNLRQLPDEGTALYTSPPAQRTWVDLTDDEIKKEFHPLHATGLQFARAVLAKSKEKNA